jgi:hypothetical protein
MDDSDVFEIVDRLCDHGKLGGPGSLPEAF